MPPSSSPPPTAAAEHSYAKLVALSHHFVRSDMQQLEVDAVLSLDVYDNGRLASLARICSSFSWCICARASPSPSPSYECDSDSDSGLSLSSLDGDINNTPAVTQALLATDATAALTNVGKTVDDLQSRFPELANMQYGRQSASSPVLVVSIPNAVPGADQLHLDYAFKFHFRNSSYSHIMSGSLVLTQRECVEKRHMNIPFSALKRSFLMALYPPEMQRVVSPEYCEGHLTHPCDRSLRHSPYVDSDDNGDGYFDDDYDEDADSENIYGRYSDATSADALPFHAYSVNSMIFLGRDSEEDVVDAVAGDSADSLDVHNGLIFHGAGSIDSDDSDDEEYESEGLQVVNFDTCQGYHGDEACVDIDVPPEHEHDDHRSDEDTDEDDDDDDDDEVSHAANIHSAFRQVLARFGKQHSSRQSLSRWLGVNASRDISFPPVSIEVE
ncbi:hypothetical protein RI367_002212 [Sorochytrium milnesiophthora]